MLLRALEARSEVYLWNHEAALALQTAKEMIRLEPFREGGHRLVIRSDVARGNAQAILRNGILRVTADRLAIGSHRLMIALLV